ncbi:MAG: hypothetical protein ACI4KM_04610 [Oscillospiraceae bacterium]
MQAELHFVCRLAASVRAALNNGTDFKFALADYMDKAEFRFMPRKRSLFGGFSTSSPDMWYNHLLELGLCDIFAQTDSTIRCIFEGGAAMEFTVTLRSHKVSLLDSDCGPAVIDGAIPAIGWSFAYRKFERVKASVTERMASYGCENPPYEPKQLCLAIENMERFSASISEAEYARRFQQAAQLFDGKQVITGNRIEPLPTIGGNMPLYLSAEHADVLFEGCPLEIAAKNSGRGEEYTQLCNELSKQIRRAMVYAVNSAVTITAPQGV